MEAAQAATAAKEAAKEDLYCPVCKKKFKSQKQWQGTPEGTKYRV